MNTEIGLVSEMTVFDTFIPIEPEKKFDVKSKSFFLTYSLGLATGRDAWVYNFSELQLKQNVKRTLNSYNEQSKAFINAKRRNSKLKVDDFIDADPKKISWNRNLKEDLAANNIHSFNSKGIVIGYHRPFCKYHLYFDKILMQCCIRIENCFLHRTTKIL